MSRRGVEVFTEVFIGVFIGVFIEIFIEISAAAEARAGELNDPEVVAQLKSKLAQLAGGA